MSTYTSDAINPKTGKTQTALFIDDFYGAHQYAVAFRKDGQDSQITDGLDLELYDIYSIDDVERVEAGQATDEVTRMSE